MVMQEMAAPRETFVLVRGQYDKHGERVTPGVPASLPPLASDAPPNRLGLAQWMVDPAHPLTARVIVNRYWQMYFGTGIVKTSEDFGTQGEFPTHPELLDWLATHFVASGWDVKAMQRLIVTSATYRQVSARHARTAGPGPGEPPAGPRRRGSACRPNSFATRPWRSAGCLNPAIGGASVSPYQPPGLWEELMSRADGATGRPRRTCKATGRTCIAAPCTRSGNARRPPPTLTTFDAPDRETCTVRRARTNTPLQALVLLNDPTYVEASRKLAERLLTEAGPAPANASHWLSAWPRRASRSARELAVLGKLLDQQLAAYRQNPDAVKKLLGVGESPADGKLDPAELAAWTTVASVILNLDETITKG